MTHFQSAMSLVCADNIVGRVGDCICIIGRVMHQAQLELNDAKRRGVQDVYTPVFGDDVIRELLEICGGLCALKLEFLGGNTSMHLIEQAIPLTRRVYELAK
jgi:hypothetical protein